MDSHEKYAALLDAFIDGELSEQEAEEVRGHLALCADCQAYVADALAMREAFPDIEETVVPDGFAESVMAALPPRQVTWRKQWAKIALPLAACAAVVLLVRGLPGDRIAGMGGASGSGMEKAALFDMDAGGGTLGAAFSADDADTMPPESPEAIEEYSINAAGASESGSAPEQRSAVTVSVEDADAETVSDDIAEAETVYDMGAAFNGNAGTQTDSDGNAGTQTSSGSASKKNAEAETIYDTGRTSGENSGTQTGADTGTASGENNGTQTSSDTGTASNETAGTGTTSNEPMETQTDSHTGTAFSQNADAETVSNGNTASSAASVTQTPETLPAPEPATKAVPTETPPDEDAIPEEDTAMEFGVTEIAEENETADLSSVSVWTIPVEAISLLSDYAPAGETESGIWYALTPEELGELFQNLADMDMEAVYGTANANETPPLTFPGVEYVFVPL